MWIIEEIEMILLVKINQNEQQNETNKKMKQIRK
jgi:hypothetical protein